MKLRFMFDLLCGIMPHGIEVSLLFIASLTMIDREKGMIATIQGRFIAVREALGITQRDFCKGIYVSQSYYAQIEGGKRPVNDRIIALVCSQYGVSKEFL
ncbi:MAG: helix-turn-helix domain-containing protein, partial [Treponema sp.]|nr:helix-turn-helix domain-containing protein [Treponema sp.]